MEPRKAFKNVKLDFLKKNTKIEPFIQGIKFGGKWRIIQSWFNFKETDKHLHENKNTLYVLKSQGNKFFMTNYNKTF